MPFNRQFPRQSHREQERRTKERKIANRRPTQCRIKRRMANVAMPNEAIGVGILPCLPRRVHLDVLANGGKRLSGVDKKQPELLFPNIFFATAQRWGDQHLAFAHEMLEPVENIKRRL